MIYTPKSDFLYILQSRGFIHQATDLEALDQQCQRGPIAAYIGFDATASSLHVGSLVQIMLLRWLQKTGHKPLLLMGGGTTKVGDPSGKDTQRHLLDDETIAANMAGIKTNFQSFLSFGQSENDAVLLDNALWLDRISYIPFLRDIGVHFTLNRMLSFDSVRMRLEREQPLTFLEFNYMLMQAVDFLELNRRYACLLQMGGSDQWGNIVSGVDLVRRIEGKTVFGLTSPLITTASGAKMGKTAEGAIWLSQARLSPYEYWQFWRNTEDADVGRFLRLFTDLPLDEVARLEALQGREINEAKKRLAHEATGLLHGEAAAEEAGLAAKTGFETKAGFETRADLKALPSLCLSADLSLTEALVQAGFVPSKSEARRQAKQGGVRLGEETILNPDQALGLLIPVSGEIARLSLGKKKVVALRLKV